MPALEPSPRAILKAAETGRLSILEHIYANNPDLLNNSMFQSVANSKGYKEVLDFLKAQIPNPKTAPILKTRVMGRHRARSGWKNKNIVSLSSATSSSSLSLSSSDSDPFVKKPTMHKNYSSSSSSGSDGDAENRACKYHRSACSAMSRANYDWILSSF
jgi:hypothetical protein